LIAAPAGEHLPLGRWFAPDELELAEHL